MAHETRYVESGGLHIAYQVVGDGPVDLVSIPSYPFAPPLDWWWEEPRLHRAVERLAGIGRLILFDPPGRGLSDHDGRVHPLEEQMDHLRAVLDEVGSERATVLGWGPTGMLGMLFAASHPERVSSLVLFGSFASGTWHPDYPWGQRAEDRDGEIQTLVSSWGSASAPFFAPSMAGDERFAQIWGRMLRSEMSPGELVPVLETFAATDVRSLLPTIGVPTLVMHRVDATPSVENSRYLAAHIPGARLVELPGSDAVAWVGDWDTVADRLEDFVAGEHRVVTDTILATVLFTDVVGSTEWATELGDRRWRQLLDAHDALTSKEIERHSGTLIDRAGDGLLATFDGPARAIRSACAIRDKVRDLGIEVRAGLHTGEVQRRGGTIGGIAVHIGARVGALAGPGEVLVSRTVKDLVAGSDIGFAERGRHLLKGVPEEWELFEVVST